MTRRGSRWPRACRRRRRRRQPAPATFHGRAGRRRSGGSRRRAPGRNRRTEHRRGSAASPWTSNDGRRRRAGLTHGRGSWSTRLAAGFVRACIPSADSTCRGRHRFVLVVPSACVDGDTERCRTGASRADPSPPRAGPEKVADGRETGHEVAALQRCPSDALARVSEHEGALEDARAGRGRGRPAGGEREAARTRLNGELACARGGRGSCVFLGHSLDLAGPSSPTTAVEALCPRGRPWPTLA